MATRRPAPAPAPETEPGKLVRFDPRFDAGTVVQILVVLTSAIGIYTGLRTDLIGQRADLENVKAMSLVDRAQTSKDLTELKVSVKELQINTQDIKESLAILRGRSAEAAAVRR